MDYEPFLGDQDEGIGDRWIIKVEKTLIQIKVPDELRWIVPPSYYQIEHNLGGRLYSRGGLQGYEHWVILEQSSRISFILDIIAR